MIHFFKLKKIKSYNISRYNNVSVPKKKIVFSFLFFLTISKNIFLSQLNSYLEHSLFYSLPPLIANFHTVTIQLN